MCNERESVWLGLARGTILEESFHNRVQKMGQPVPGTEAYYRLHGIGYHGDDGSWVWGVQVPETDCL